MLAFFGYLALCLAAAVALTVGFSLVRPIREQGDFAIWKFGFAAFAGIAALPYLYAEAATHMAGTDLEQPILDAVSVTGPGAELDYYRVTYISGDRAKAVAVADLPHTWGTEARPVVQIDLRRVDGRWVAGETSVGDHYTRSVQAVNFPPYW